MTSESPFLVDATFNESQSPQMHVYTNTTGPSDTISPAILAFFRVVTRYIFPLIIGIGTVGNGLSFLVLVRKRLRGNSLYFYLMVLSVADTLVLYVSGIKTWVRAISGFELLHVSSASCKIIMFILLLSMHMAAWLVVLVTFDRFVSVWLPFRAATICTARRARIISGCLLLAAVAFDSHVFWTFDLQVEPGQNDQCKPHSDYPFMQAPFEYLKLATYSFLPFGVVFSLNMAIIAKISQGSTLLTRIQSVTTVGLAVAGASTQTSKAGTALRASHQQRVIYMLLTLTFSWLLLTAPYAIISVIITAAQDLMSMDNYVFWKTVGFVTLYMNHAINFYLYCITGKRFREEFFVLFHGYFDRWRSRSTRRKSLRTVQTPLLINLPDIKRTPPLVDESKDKEQNPSPPQKQSDKSTNG